MKRFLSLALLFAFTGAMAAARPSLAADVPGTAQTSQAAAKTYDWKAKLKRGSLNVVTSPVEVARQIQITSEESSLLKGWTVGLAKGFGSGLVRFGAGVVEVLTFPFDFPVEGKRPWVEPEYVWEKPGVKYA
ncbi:MAG TPA: exosortase system-associated protein, TIGR04073 family [Verrucomicrobiae bacterium]|jgi:putative exosortase-associated protein (TIGR04073 family)|nr:exosortase system-associated protein, TIGR04073 family [Verrucomicrobiae bacterium]